MSNANKILDKAGKKQRVQRKSRAKKPKGNIDALSDAIVDGKIIAPIGTRLVLRRDCRADKLVSFVVLKAVEADGCVKLWDETLEQWYYFQLQHPVTLKLINDLNDNVSVNEKT